MSHTELIDPDMPISAVLARIHGCCLLEARAANDIERLQAGTDPGTILTLPVAARRERLAQYARDFEADDDFPVERRILRAVLCDPSFGSDDESLAYLCHATLGHLPMADGTSETW